MIKLVRRVDYFGIGDWYDSLPHDFKTVISTEAEDLVYADNQSCTRFLWIVASNLVYMNRLDYALQVSEAVLGRPDTHEYESFLIHAVRFNVFNTLQMFEEAIASGYDCLQSLPSIVRNSRDEFGDDYTFDPSPIDFLIECCVVRLNHRELDCIENAIRAAQTTRFNDILCRSRRALDAIGKLYSLISENPGYLQRRLRSALGEYTDDARDFIPLASHLGMIRRIKSGRTYELYPTPQMPETI